MDDIADFHTIAISILAGAEDVAIEVNGFVAVRQDGRDVDLIAVGDRELFQRLVHRLLFVGFRQIKAQHGAALVSNDPLDVDVAKSAGRENTAGKF